MVFNSGNFENANSDAFENFAVRKMRSFKAFLGKSGVSSEICSYVALCLDCCVVLKNCSFHHAKAPFSKFNLLSSNYFVIPCVLGCKRVYCIELQEVSRYKDCV